jgi:dCMP deaminase
MYTTTFPCEKCAEAISEAGITEIIYYYDKSDSVKAKNIFKENRITYRYYISNIKF